MRRTGDAAGDSVARVALAWLGHPVGVAGVAVLLLNDHVLKTEFGSWWTGKLSDVAGLLFAPALLAVVVAALGGHRARPCRVALACLSVVGAGFVWVKVTVGGAAAASAVWSAIAGPSIIRQDATDLLALPALALSWWGFQRVVRCSETRGGLGRTSVGRKETDRTVGRGCVVARARALILVPIATLAVAATSGPVSHFATDLYVSGNTVYIGVRQTGGDAWDDRDSVDWYEYATWGSSWRSARWLEPGIETEAAELDRLEREGETRQTEVCLPDPETLCYRLGSEPVEVEVSYDGGKSWRHEWGLEEYQRKDVAGIPPWSGSPDEPSSSALAVVDLDAGHLVVVANGLDGIAVRHANGTWTREPVPGSDEDVVTVHDEPPTSRQALAPALVGPALVFIGCLVALGIAARNRVPSRWRVAGGVAVLATAGLLAGSVVRRNDVLAYPENDLTGFINWQWPQLLVAALLVVVALAVSEPFGGRRLTYGILLAAGAAVASSFAWILSGAWVGIAVAVATTAGGVILLRQSPDTPPPPRDPNAWPEAGTIPAAALPPPPPVDDWTADGVQFKDRQ